MGSERRDVKLPTATKQGAIYNPLQVHPDTRAPRPLRPPNAAQIVALQRGIGNRATADLLASAAPASREVRPSLCSGAATGGLVAVQRFGGRRTDFRAGEIVIHVVIAGSGYDCWATHRLSVPDSRGPGRRADKEADTEEPVHYRRDRRGPAISFAGPGAPITKGGGVSVGNVGNWAVAGVGDVGSNSIANLVGKVPALVMAGIDAERAKDDAAKVVVLVKAHSRGAVAGSRIAKILDTQLKGMGLKGGSQVELVQFDPVPGPVHTGADMDIDVGGLEESALIYSMNSGKNLAAAFDPQAVTGAKRIIVTSQPHSAGLLEGFHIGTKRFKGSGINRLPRGVYFDVDGKGMLQEMTGYDEAAAFCRFKDPSAWGDDRRGMIVQAVVYKFFHGKLPAPPARQQMQAPQTKHSAATPSPGSRHGLSNSAAIKPVPASAPKAPAERFAAPTMPAQESDWFEQMLAPPGAKDKPKAVAPTANQKPSNWDDWENF